MELTMEAGQCDALARTIGQRQTVWALGALLVGTSAWPSPEPASARECHLVGGRCQF